MRRYPALRPHRIDEFAVEESGEAPQRPPPGAVLDEICDIALIGTAQRREQEQRLVTAQPDDHLALPHAGRPASFAARQSPRIDQ
jgi:hypothetical protein